MKTAKIGAIVRGADPGPPWIVVDHSIDSIVVARWPGRLWNVEILKAASDQPDASANYTRVVSVRVLEERPVSILFGTHGQAVCRVIERAGALTVEDLPLLRDSHPLARSAYSRAWLAWLGRTEPESSDPAEDYADTLAVSGASTRSPIGSGFTVLYSAVTERVRNLVGNAAFIVDEEGEQSLAPAWAEAAQTFLHAAMAYGAPELTSPADVQALTAAWLERYAEEP